MSIKTGFILGFGLGYVLGSRAGRERYEQLKQMYNRVSGNPAVQQFAERGKEVAGEAGRKGLSVVTTGVQKVGSSVKNRLQGEEGNGFATGEASI
jgi:hypothetical protein